MHFDIKVQIVIVICVSAGPQDGGKPATGRTPDCVEKSDLVCVVLMIDADLPLIGKLDAGDIDRKPFSMRADLAA